MMQHVWEAALDVITGNQVLLFVANTCVTISMIILFLILIRPLMKKLPRIGMYVLWFMVLLRMLCPFTIHGIYSILPEEVEQAVAQTNDSRKVENIAARLREERKKDFGGVKNQYRLSLPGKQTVSPQLSEEQTTDRHRADGQMTEAQSGETQLGDTQTEGDRRWEDVSAADVVTLVWVAGVLCCIAVTIISLVRTKHRYRDARRLFDNVYTHPLVSGSFVGGILSPRIYVPEGMPVEEQKYVLCHEQVHIRRRDYLHKPFAFCVFSLLWFNPLVWIAYHLMMRDMEVSCDEMAVRGFSGAEKKEYSYLLLSMAESGNGMFSQNPAFGAGIVKERIVSVMKGKKMTGAVTAFVIMAVMLCSCGIASAPEQTTVPVSMPKETETDVYVEQALSGEVYEDIKVEGYSVNDSGVITMDPDGKLVTLVEMFRTPEEMEYKFGKAVYDDVWVLEEAAWMDQLNKEAAEKNYSLDDLKYGADGCLYIQFQEDSMPQTKYWANREKYKDDYYPLHNHLYKIDEQTGEMTEVSLPEESFKEAYEAAGIQEDDIPEGMMGYDFTVFADGNILMRQYSGSLLGIYSGVTGEKVADVDTSGHYQNGLGRMVAGDGFFIFPYEESGNVRVEVVGEDGERINSIPIDGVTYDMLVADEPYSVELGTSESTILMATPDGIFETELGDTEFTNVVNGEKDNVYYLTLGSYYIESFVGKSEDGDYALSLWNMNSGNGGTGSRSKLCRYTRSGE